MSRKTPLGLWPKAVAVAVCALCCASAGASVITFSNATGNPNAGASANTGALGSTAHVAVGYSAYSYLYTSGYGGLGGGTGTAIYSGNSPSYTEAITFVASAGYLVTLDSFDLAQYVTNHELVDIAVTGGSTSYGLTSQQPVGGASFTTYSPGVTGTSLTLTITNLYNVGLNNIVFTESVAPAAVPEPASLGLVGIGGLAWALAARRRRPVAAMR